MALTGVITGKNGVLKSGTSGTAYGSLTDVRIKNWSVTISGGVIDVTDSQSGDARNKVGGKRYEWSGSAEAILRAGDSELVVNQVYSLALVAEDTTGDEVYWIGDAVITSLGVSTPIEGEDVVSKTINFSGTGSLTKVDNTGS